MCAQRGNRYLNLTSHLDLRSLSLTQISDVYLNTYFPAVASARTRAQLAEYLSGSVVERERDLAFM